MLQAYSSQFSQIIILVTTKDFTFILITSIVLCKVFGYNYHCHNIRLQLYKYTHATYRVLIEIARLQTNIIYTYMYMLVVVGLDKVTCVRRKTQKYTCRSKISLRIFNHYHIRLEVRLGKLWIRVGKVCRTSKTYSILYRVAQKNIDKPQTILGLLSAWMQKWGPQLLLVSSEVCTLWLSSTNNFIKQFQKIYWQSYMQNG